MFWKEDLSDRTQGDSMEVKKGVHLRATSLNPGQVVKVFPISLWP